jgi:putative acetyltransferase
MTVSIQVVTSNDMDIIRALFTDYAQNLGFDLGFQNFAAELATLPGGYAPPGGCLLLARVEGKPAGCVALRPLAPGICEMKRLYVRPELRSRGIGRMLVERVIAEARMIGYGKMRLDTVPGMEEAIGLYRRFGFRKIAPYRFNPLVGALYFELDLKGEQDIQR